MASFRFEPIESIPPLLSKVQPVDPADAPCIAVSAFANTERAVTHVRGAMGGLMHRSKKVLFDHLVGANE